MMSDDRATNAYLGNALVPMLQALPEPMVPGGPRFLDAVLAFEIINEPEGMSRFWRLYKVRLAYDESVVCCTGPARCTPLQSTRTRGARMPSSCCKGATNLWLLPFPLPHCSADAQLQQHDATA
jgi:hypothetical protein